MSEQPKKLFLLDGMALVYRAHFAFIRNPIINSQRINTSAMFGFTNALLDILENHNPTHIGVAFDTKDPTPRHKIFPEYKAQRDAMPEDLAFAIPHVKRIIEAFNIPVIECPGYEADDIIGTIAYQADAEGDFHTYMVTPDKDFAQLVSPTTSMWKPGRKGNDTEVLDVHAILEQWEVKTTSQVIDILALWGDAADNIPGVPGIGEKTAKKLIGLYDSVEGLLENTDKLKGKQKENVENNRKQAMLSKELVKIILDVPHSVRWDDLIINERNEDAIKSLFTEFEFNSLGKRLFGASFSSGRGYTSSNSSNTSTSGTESAAELPSAKLKTISDFKKNYTLIDSENKLTQFVKKLSNQDLFCFDLETTSLNPRTAELLGVAISWESHTAYYISTSGELNSKSILKALSPTLQSNKTKIGHNLKYDLSVLLALGADCAGPFFDTMLAHSLTHYEHRHSMDYLAESMLGYSPIKLADIVPSDKDAQSDTSIEPHSEDDLFSLAKKKTRETKTTKVAKKKANSTIIDMRSLPIDKLCEYACEDADITWQLAELLAEHLDESGQQEVFYDIESELLPVLVRMEHAGIAINTDSLADINVTLESKISHLSISIEEQAGRSFNLKSPKQLGEVLFDEMQLVEKPKKTKTGQYKTDEATLSSLASKHQIVSEILEFREASKLKSTYVDALPSHQCESDQRIHSSFHQLVAATGRLASTDPNIQNIPVRTEAGREIRKAFVPAEGCILCAADYSQVELRVMAAIAGDQAMIQAFKDDQDIHSATAAKVYGVGINEVTSNMRRTAKMVNFGIIYGISAFGLSQRLSIPRGEAAEIIDTYFKEYPAIKNFMDSTIEEAHENGYITTLTGRRRVLRDINSRNGNIRNNAERAAINTPIQGTAADMIKIAMINLDKVMLEENYKSTMLLQVHDELIFDMTTEEKTELSDVITREMQQALPLPNDVPVKVDVGYGENWLQAH